MSRPSQPMYGRLVTGAEGKVRKYRPALSSETPQTTRVEAADEFNAVARISNALTSSERLLAEPSETRIAWG